MTFPVFLKGSSITDHQDVSDIANFSDRQFHNILSDDDQDVSDIHISLKASLTTTYPMTVRMLVTLHIFGRQSHHIMFCDQQLVSESEQYCTVL